MSIFGNKLTTQVTNPYESVDFGIVIESATAISEIQAETMEDLATLECALYVTDVMLEEAALEGTQNVEILMENAFSSTFKAIKDKMLKLWAKIKEFFRKMKDYLRTFFISGEKFVKEYRVQILKKSADAKGFTYKMYPYHNGKDETTSLINSAMTLRSKVTDASKTKQEIIDELKKEIYGKKTEAEHFEELRKELRGGDSKEEYKGFGGKSPEVDDLMKAVQGKTEALKTITDAEKEVSDMFKGIIKDCDDKMKDKETSAEDLKEAQIDSAIATLVSTYCTRVSNTASDIVKEYAKAAEGILKSLVRASEKSITKESATTSVEGESILESALRFI